jgi:hypothetical protein
MKKSQKVTKNSRENKREPREFFFFLKKKKKISRELVKGVAAGRESDRFYKPRSPV